MSPVALTPRWIMRCWYLGRGAECDSRIIYFLDLNDPSLQYGMMIAFGFIANFVFERECRRKNLSSGFASSLVMWAAISGLIGGRIYDILDNLHAYRAEPARAIFSGSGFVWYRGLIGGTLGCRLATCPYKMPILQMAHDAALRAAIGKTLGRGGCFLSVDGDLGVPTKLPVASPSRM